jgi:hypothetical protein
MLPTGENKPKLYEVNDGVLHLNLHPGQSRVWDSRRRFVFMVAGTQGGKTSFGPWWLHREIMDKGSGDYLAVTSSYDLFKLKLLPELRTVFEEVLKIGRYWSADKVIEISDPETGEFWATRSDDPMWARIVLRSAVSKGGLESATAKAAWLDECGQPEFTLESWEAILRRLSLNRGRVLGTTTPYVVGWFKNKIVDRFYQGDPAIDLIQFESISNPIFSMEEFEERKASMPRWRFDMFYRGQFTKPAGMIYQDFVNQGQAYGGHIIDPFEIPENWPRWVGIDPGAVTTAISYMAQDPETGTFYVYRNLQNSKKSTREQALDLLSTNLFNREVPIAYFLGQRSETQQRLDWSDAGVRPVFPPPFHDVESGIDRVIELLKTRRLFFLAGLDEMFNEFDNYSRVLDESGEPTQAIKDKERYHNLDSLRYVVSGALNQIDLWDPVLVGDEDEALLVDDLDYDISDMSDLIDLDVYGDEPSTPDDQTDDDEAMWPGWVE